MDTGGTFTDFVWFDGTRLHTCKVLSTPDAPERSILAGIEKLGLVEAMRAGTLRIVHGTTIATNAALQGKGARTAFITNAGFTDLLTIGRQAREDLYALHVAPAQPPVPPSLCFGVSARIDAHGQQIARPDTAQLAALAQELVESGAEAVAISLLFSYLDPEQEAEIARAMPPGLYVSCSSDVLPRIGEYERAVATWLNARLGPLVAGYLERLQRLAAPSTLAIMQSDGMHVPAEQAPQRAVRLLLSGPAGGLAAAGLLGRITDTDHLLTFDMGGTSTDVAAILGEPQLTAEGRIGSLPLAVPALNIHTIGAGGGSLAHVDEGGILHVGPQSAGATPGPACYGQGGLQATVTDANVVLGRLPASRALGGSLMLEAGAAHAALSTLGHQLGVTAEQAAVGVVELANEHMAAALRQVSVARGLDPATFTLCCFGGAGGLHVCDLADLLQIRTIIVPVHAGIFSALGMLAAAPGRSLTLTREWRLDAIESDTVEQTFADMESTLQDDMMGSGVPDTAIRFRRTAELRYAGQSFTLTLPWRSMTAMADAFHHLHRQTYGHAFPQRALELVHLGVQAHTQPGLTAFPPPATALKESEAGETRLIGHAEPVPVYARNALPAKTTIEGPALICEETTTTFVKAGWQATSTEGGAILLQTRPV